MRADRMRASELRRAYEASLPGWFEANREYNLDKPLAGLERWLRGDSDAHFSVKRFHFEMQFWHNKVWQARSLSGDRPSSADLALATRCLISEFVFCVPVHLQRPRNRQTVSIEWWAWSLAQAIAVGWKDHAELQARSGFEQLRHVLNDGITGHAFPYFAMELAKSWLGADVDLRTPWRSSRFPDLGPWSDLLRGWREPRAEAFKSLLDRSADYHLDQSRETRVEGHDEDPDHAVYQYEVEFSQYWLFPVLLFAVLRLRDWTGLPNPALDHELFAASPLGRLPEPVAYPAHPLLDAVEAKYRGLFPATPSLSDLPALRLKQTRAAGRA